ncbi:MAG: hypothetical protein WBW71_09490 [Bacteroidota bacterium]
MDILIIEPTGAICINPNLGAFVKLLCDNAFHVDIVSLENNYSQDWSYPNSNLILCKRGSLEGNIPCLRKLKSAYNLIIGVDQSIIAASVIAEQMSVPFGFVSYEILFADEAGVEYKTIEINACKNVSFAISQDETRAILVSREYGIPLEKIFCVPVSDGFERDIPKSDLLREHFNIPAGKKIALFSGAVTKRSMIDELLCEVNNWDSKWVLVLHSYIAFSKSEMRNFRKKYDTGKIYFSDLRITTIERLLNVMASADVGISFFTPNFSSKYECKNTLFMGLSSGKFAMYLKAGLPVIINEIGEMSNLVRQNDLGIVVQKMSQTNPSFLESMNIADLRDRCKKVYLRHFDFNRYSKGLLEIVKQSFETGTKRERNISVDPTSPLQRLSYINQLSYWFNQARDARTSKNYLLGQNIVSPNLLVWWLYKKVKAMAKKILRYEPRHFVLQFNDNLIGFYTSDISKQPSIE